MRLVLSTRNAHKVREFAGLLDGVDVAPLPDEVELPPETGDTFAGNALVKARTAAAATGGAAIADDSGIESAALGGAPGVRSARFAGEHATDEENLDKLLREAPAGSALAYVCAIAYVDGDEERLFEGRCTGRMADEAEVVVRGEHGEGLTPHFDPGAGLSLQRLLEGVELLPRAPRHDVQPAAGREVIEEAAVFGVPGRLRIEEAFERAVQPARRRLGQRSGVGPSHATSGPRSMARRSCRGE